MKRIIISLFIMYSVNIPLSAEWSMSNSFQLLRGKFYNNTASHIYYLYTGIRYQDENWSIYASVPIMAYNNPATTSDGQNSNSMMNGGMMSMNVGLGDIYSYIDYNLITDEELFPDVSIGGILKLPTAIGVNSLGSSTINAGVNLNLRKLIGTFSAFADLGYLYIGNSNGTNYRSPLIYGAGLGKFFENGLYSLLIYYGAYSQVVTDYQAPRQLSLGINYRLSHGVFINLIGGAGLSNYSPDYILSTGIRYTL